MRAFFAFWLPVVAVVCVATPATPAQFGGRANALGGSAASRGASIHPLGGFSGPGRVARNFGSRGYGERRNGNPAYVYPYAYSYYVPGYFDDGYYDQNSYAPAAPAVVYAPQVPAPAARQPVVINQYFGMQSAPAAHGPEQVVNTPAAPGDLIGAPQNYYLIAYKNHAVYPAIAYWVEDKTLHYVTTQNTHNQASLDLIDLKLTKSLNQSRDVPFSIPGQ